LSLFVVLLLCRF